MPTGIERERVRGAARRSGRSGEAEEHRARRWGCASRATFTAVAAGLSSGGALRSAAQCAAVQALTVKVEFVTIFENFW